MKYLEIKNTELIRRGFAKTKSLSIKVKKRMKAMKMVADGLSKKEISRRLMLGKNTVYRWVKRANEEGIDGLKDKEGRGRKMKLKENELKELKKIMKKKPSEVGCFGDEWTGKMLGVYIKKEFEVEYKKSNLHEILKKYKRK